MASLALPPTISFGQTEVTDSALEDCRNYTFKLEDYAQKADQALAVVLKQRDEAENRAIKAVNEQSLLPVWAWTLIGVGVGGMAVEIFKK